ncbi:MAG: hypothetical protein Q8Q09_27230 [Deltaproteobacteria bacterium]|nr:hypothetical protein [Deltaproteobacteria bacterium]
MSDDWLAIILRRLASNSGMGLLRVRGAHHSALTILVRSLIKAGHSVTLTSRVQTLREADPKNVVIYLPRVDEAEAVNIERPIFADRALRVIFWIEDDTYTQVRTVMRDALDWVVTTVDAPSRITPAFWQLNLKAAITSGAAGVRWDRRESVIDLLTETVGSVAFLEVDVSRSSYQEILDVINTREDRWLIFRGIGDDSDRATKRVRWALAATDQHQRTILVSESHGDTVGWWRVRTAQIDPLTFEDELSRDGRQRLQRTKEFLASCLCEFELVDPMPELPSEMNWLRIANSEDPLASWCSLDRSHQVTWDSLPQEGWNAWTRSRSREPEWAKIQNARLKELRSWTVGGPSVSSLLARRVVVERLGDVRVDYRFPNDIVLTDDFAATVELRLATEFSAGEWSKYFHAYYAMLSGDLETATTLHGSDHFGQYLESDMSGSEPKEFLKFFRRIGSLIEAGKINAALKVETEVSAQLRGMIETHDLDMLLIEIHSIRGEFSEVESLIEVTRNKLTQRPPCHSPDYPYFIVAHAEPDRDFTSIELEYAILRSGFLTSQELERLTELRQQFGASIGQDTRIQIRPSITAAMYALLQRDLAQAEELSSSAVYMAEDGASPHVFRRALLLLAYCQLEQGGTGEAVETLQRVLDQDNVRRNPYHPHKLRALLELARVDRKRGLYSSARSKLTKILRGYKTSLPRTAPDWRCAEVESATLVLVEQTVTIVAIGQAENALSELSQILSPLHWDVVRARGEIDAAIRRLALLAP